MRVAAAAATSRQLLLYAAAIACIPGGDFQLSRQSDDGIGET